MVSEEREGDFFAFYGAGGEDEEEEDRRAVAEAAAEEAAGCKSLVSAESGAVAADKPIYHRFLLLFFEAFLSSLF